MNVIKVGKILTVLILFIFFVGCGYRPSSQYSKRILGNKIYAEVFIDVHNPENSVLIKDAVNEAIVAEFKSKIVDKKDEANSEFFVKFNSISFTPTAYDPNGYVVAYRATVSLNIIYIDKFGKKGTFNVSGIYDFSIEANSVISDTKRFDAIKFASYKAIGEFVSKVAIKGILNGNENK